ncbi:type II toxin-antitoxin system Phd/YefM family antitoxin [Endozoicomonas euniceicola]|uniref:Antitoxin n=1 Tax=Endozoicomonas euniceicola TaxID=1234143 RepID=A0ABY6H0G7_9GAMM|nr:type II toxin-antitoxin system prevent-host-death family antitoxin [Endozoicomonas euniceicola]UYM18535.1 type II toxin-antitoxin system prevent-host-death family antitoxin [Endozoicomonas euniceicola]
MNVVSYTEMRKNLKYILDSVVNDATHTIVHRRDAEDVIVMSKESYDSLMETLYLLSSPENAGRLKSAAEQFRINKGIRKDLPEL